MTLLTSDDILCKTFPNTNAKGGYEEAGVDDYLDEVVNTVRELEATITSLTLAQSAPAPFQEPAAPSAPESAAALLALAVQMHDDHIAAGRTAADALLRDAQVASERELGALEDRRTTLERQIRELEEFEGTFRRRLSAHLEQLLQQVNTPPEGA